MAVDRAGEGEEGGEGGESEEGDNGGHGDDDMQLGALFGGDTTAAAAVAAAVGAPTVGGAAASAATRNASLPWKSLVVGVTTVQPEEETAPFESIRADQLLSAWLITGTSASAQFVSNMQRTTIICAQFDSLKVGDAVTTEVCVHLCVCVCVCVCGCVCVTMNEETSL